MKPQPSHKILIGIISASFLLSLCYSFLYKIEPVVDARSYDQIAVNLLAGQGFKEDSTLSYEFDPSIIRAGPLYEFFLAGVYGTFGYHFEVVWILQALLHAATAFIIFLTARILFPERGDAIGLVAAALIGFHPDLIEISAMLMTETLYLFLVTLTVFLFFKVYQKPSSLRLALLLGASTGLSLLIRPPVLLFVPVFLCLFGIRKEYKGAAAFLLTLVLFLSPWVMRNYVVYKQFIPTTLIGEYNVWVGNTLVSDGGQLSMGDNPATAYLETNGVFGFKEKAGVEFRSFVRLHPMQFIELSAVRTIRYMSLIRPMGFWFYESGLPQLTFIALSGLSIMILFVTGAAGLWRVFQQKKEWRYYVAALALAAPLPLIFTVVQSRYRFQVYPLLALFGAYFLVELYKRSPGAFKTGCLTLALFLVVTAIDAAAFWPVVVERLGKFF
ncbi:MAG: glycosyltransferase family 39 protein [bacterium]|nr:glycosyltransferase family 39 protein [bacterium]